MAPEQQRAQQADWPASCDEYSPLFSNHCRKLL
jgi:hypothetical protein